MRSHCSLQQRRPRQQQRPSTAKIKNTEHPRTEIRVVIKGKIQCFHLRGHLCFHKTETPVTLNHSHFWTASTFISQGSSRVQLLCAQRSPWHEDLQSLSPLFTWGL